jgi:hypothetical protein
MTLPEISSEGTYDKMLSRPLQPGVAGQEARGCLGCPAAEAAHVRLDRPAAGAMTRPSREGTERRSSRRKPGGRIVADSKWSVPL